MDDTFASAMQFQSRIGSADRRRLLLFSQMRQFFGRLLQDVGDGDDFGRWMTLLHDVIEFDQAQFWRRRDAFGFLFSKPLQEVGLLLHLLVRLDVLARLAQ